MGRYPPHYRARATSPTPAIVAVQWFPERTTCGADILATAPSVDDGAPLLGQCCQHWQPGVARSRECICIVAGDGSLLRQFSPDRTLTRPRFVRHHRRIDVVNCRLHARRQRA